MDMHLVSVDRDKVTSLGFSFGDDPCYGICVIDDDGILLLLHFLSDPFSSFLELHKMLCWSKTLYENAVFMSSVTFYPRV